jgi:hypothetical protein
MRRFLTAAAAIVALVPVLVTARAAASPSEPAKTGDYCVVHVTGQTTSGELMTSSPRCYERYAAAMQSEGVTAYGTDASQVALADFQIGLHCDGYGLAAPCTSVVGSSCSGGWLNVSAAWNNRISSTLSGCPQINHYDGYNLTGGVWAVFGSGPHNLTLFNNRTSSMQYT